MDDLPSEYDAIVVGTGMIESIVAAALSRIGKSVLHLDSNDFYGENWASFNLEGFKDWAKIIQEGGNNVDDSFSDIINENETLVKLTPNRNVFNIDVNDYTENKSDIKNSIVDKELKPEENSLEKDINIEKLESSEEKLNSTKKDLWKQSRKFNLDLCPKLLFSNGQLVQLLITSNIARYAEFKSVSRVLTWREGQLEPVPCSRADVFATKNVTVVQKRLLVKILTLFANYHDNLEEFSGFENKTFLEYLKHKKLPENLIHYILYAIAMGDNTTSCMQGVKNSKAFLESLGRYGNTPFIFPLYGSGELPQCFCRLCAVFGGVYCLQRGIEALIVKDGECIGVVSNKKRLNAKIVILSSRFVPMEYLEDSGSEDVSRGIFITDRSILKGDKESLTLLKFPPISQVSDKSITVLELGPGTCTCPENYFLVHMTAKKTKDASLDFKHVVDALFNINYEEENQKPKVLWSTTWNVSNKTSQTTDSCVKNLKVCCSVDSELDYNFSVSEARRIFKDICPNEEFLPRAPDPEEIILDGEETTDGNTDVSECEITPASENNSDNTKEKDNCDVEESKEHDASVTDGI